MSDDIDRANDRAQEDLERAIKAARGITTNSGNPKDSADECVECGLEIPSERQIALPGVNICFHCASTAERKRKLFI